MNGTGIAYHRTSFLVLAAILAAAGVLAAIDVRNQTDPAFLTDGNNTVTKVFYGGPAAGAGLESGDRILSIDNIPVEDADGFAHHARPDIDEVWIYVVRRGTDTFNISIRQGALSLEQLILLYAAKLAGLAFVWYGVRAYTLAPNPATTMLAFAGFGLGASLLGAPYAPWPVLRSLLHAFFDAAGALGLAALLHFLLLFPTRHAVLDKPGVFRLIYGPARGERQQEVEQGGESQCAGGIDQCVEQRPQHRPRRVGCAEERRAEAEPRERQHRRRRIRR